jgi:hypothetical protein
MAYPEQPSYIRIGSAWKQIEQVFVRKSSAWKRVNQAYVYESGAWKRVYAYDSIAPTILSFSLTDTVSGQTYGSSKTTASYSLQFSEPIVGWDDEMITISSNPGDAWEITSITTADDTTYVVEIEKTGTQTSGTVTLSVDPDGITDESEINAWDGSPRSSQSFSIDVTRPAVAEFVSSSPAASRTVTFTLRFSESVTGLLESEFTIGGTSEGWEISSFSGSGAIYTIVLTEESLDSTTNGTLTLSIPENSVSDAIGNTGPDDDITSSTFTVARTPGTPSISAISSSDLTLHTRRVNYTVSVPAGFTTISHVVGYLYDANDTYTGTSQTIDVTDTTSAFTVDGSFSVGRNPSTKYYVRARSLNTSSLYSEYTQRAEITTGNDRTPPVLAAPTVTANTPADPGYPGASVTRSLSYSFASPSSYLTAEVSSVTVYCIRDSDGASVGSAEHVIGSGWGSGALTGTFSGLPASTGYYIFARSVDIYGGANSTADSASTSATTTAQQNGTDYYTAYRWSAESNWSAETGTFEVTGNSFSQTSTFEMPGTSNESGTQYRTSSIRIEAWVVTTGINITSSGRSFIVDFSGTDTSASTSGGTLNGFQAPWSNNSGLARQDKTMAWTLAYGNPGAGRIRVRGAGSIGTVQTSPTDQRIRVKVYMTGKQKTWESYIASRGYSW